MGINHKGRPVGTEIYIGIDKEQRRAFAIQQSQAKFRKEEYNLTFEEFALLWNDKWHLRGMNSQSLCLTRVNTSKAWSIDNCMLQDRLTKRRITGEETKIRNRA